MAVRAILPAAGQSAGRSFICQLVTYDLAGTVQRAREALPGTRRILFAQTLLIGTLLVQRRLRALAQGQLRESELRFRRA